MPEAKQEESKKSKVVKKAPADDAWGQAFSQKPDTDLEDPWGIKAASKEVVVVPVEEKKVAVAPPVEVKVEQQQPKKQKQAE